MLSMWIVQKDLLLLIRNKKALLTLLLMPLILIAILGSAFSNMFASDEDETVAMFHIGVVNEDGSEQSNRFVEDVLQNQLSNFMTIEQLSRAEINEAMDSERISVTLLIPKGFGDQLINNNLPEVELISAGDSSIQTSIIESALIQYQQVNAGVTATVTTLTNHYTELAQSGEAINMERYDANSEMMTLAEPIHEVTVSGTEKTIGSFQYYAVAMGVMFLTMTVVTLVGTMIEEKNDTVYARQLTTRLVAGQYVIGKFIGLLIISLVQLSLIVGGTSLLYGVDWGDSIAAILLTMFSFTLSTTGLGVLVGSFMKTEESFGSIGMIGTQIMSALGGSFVPIYMFPDWMVAISKVLPNALALQMFMDIMTGEGVATIANEAIIATGVGLLLLALAWMRLARKGGIA
ncbi:MAG: ABC transporter permease [Candidatus Pristimantibacillus lignocellulolyticus]|uniref:ABC transporter permease n=1 Tax=Candidatus Pristimantibacillus lignocellulolyticus TaxID=2994561 RepID=A0A9J6ZJK3_9BACL|nr:MAG: ABC transporter permease [Candidatus Pristimantibacillus lignocellulolyticus]